MSNKSSLSSIRTANVPLSHSHPPTTDTMIIGNSDGTSPFARLPTEIVISIFEIAAASSKPTAAALARTCRMVHSWVEPVLYRTVVLHTKAQNDLFERTMRTKDPGFFHQHLKYFAPARGHGYGLSESPIEGSRDSLNGNGVGVGAAHGHGHGHGHQHGEMPYTGQWHAIKDVHALVMSTSCRPTDTATGRIRPHEVAIRGFVRPKFFAYPAFQSVTHLFLCDVPLVYTSVLSQIILALPYLPSLTHLACPFSNKWRGEQHNVCGEVCTLLKIDDLYSPTKATPPPPTLDAYGQPLQAEGPNTPNPNPTDPSSSSPSSQPQTRLEMLLLNVWHYQEPDLERESYIWSQLAQIEDKRLFLQPGEAFSVKKWEENAANHDYGFGEDLWERAKRGAEGWRSWVR